MSHIGEIVRIANPNAVGLINDHVEVRHGSVRLSDVYHVYARGDFYAGSGPEPFPKDEGYGKRYDERKRRGWTHTAKLGEDFSSLQEAMKLGEAEAIRRNVVMYFSDDDTTIKWLPPEWIPRMA